MEESNHPNSIKIMEALKEIDSKFFNDYFDWRTGGEGDNGEILMAQLNIFFNSKGLS